MLHYLIKTSVIGIADPLKKSDQIAKKDKVTFAECKCCNSNYSQVLLT